MQAIRVGIIGVSGYGGAETARLVSEHPLCTLAYVTSNTYEGKPLYAAVPGLCRRTDLRCVAFEPAAAAAQCDVVFLAGEAGLAMKCAPELLDAGLKVIDLSADFRLKDPHAYSAWYKAEHESPQLLPQAVYGLPELHSESIREARLVANPGCYPTSAILALAPLLHNAEGSSIDPGSLIVDSLSGVSGAGRSKFGPATHFAEVNESVSPYAVGGIHRHTPEIEQALTQIAARPISITFTPHLVPITRGILTTAYADVAERHEDFHALYRNYYKDKPFVVVLEPGEFPATKHVYGTNNCHIGLTVDEHTNRIIVVSAIDNLIKGMAGQAIQNMNLMFGVDETAGLPASAVWP